MLAILFLVTADQSSFIGSAFYQPTVALALTLCLGDFVTQITHTLHYG